MEGEISLEITETINKVEVTEDVTSINITPNVTTVEVKGISIARSVGSTSIAYNGTNNTLARGASVASALDHVNANGLNKNMDQTIDGNITFDDTHTITFPTQSTGYNALLLNNNNIGSVNNITSSGTFTNTGGISSTSDITSTTLLKAPDIRGSLEGPVVFKAVKDNSVTLAKGDVVYVSGSINNVTSVDKADCSNSAKMPAFGIVSSVNNNDVEVTNFGSVPGINTENYSLGDSLYVSTTGTLSSTKPTGEGNIVQNLALVESSGPTNITSISVPSQIFLEQKVYISALTKSSDGTQITVTLTYLCGDTTTTGVGFYLNFDSNLLTYASSSNYFTTGLTAAGVLEDGNKLDYAWADTGGNWPQQNTINLVDVTFNVSENADGESTDLTFTNISNAEGYTFIGQSQTIKNLKRGTQTAIGALKVLSPNHVASTPNLNSGNFFLGVNNVATPSNFNTSVQNYLSSGDCTGLILNGNTTVNYGNTLNFTAANSGGATGQQVYSAMNLANNDIINVNKITFADVGPNEGLSWSNIKIYESTDDLSDSSNNVAGNFQVVYKQSNGQYARRFTVRDTGVDVVGTITFDGGTTSADLNFGDGDKAVFGNESDLQIYHDGGHSYIEDTGTGNLNIDGSRVKLRSASNVDMVKAIGGGAVEIYHAGDKKLETTADGAAVTGDLSVSGDLIINGDTTTLNVQTVEVEDNTLLLNKTGTSATAATSGISVYRGQGATEASFIFDEGDDTWDLTNNLQIAGNLNASGDLTATTQTYPDNTTKVATTEYITTAIANNPGPTGPQGDTGAQGATGAQGPQGAQGPHGFVGAQGAVGPHGVEGIVGAQGDTGAQGAVGPHGVEGAVGAQGAVGPHGVEGAVGAQGVDGIVGAHAPGTSRMRFNVTTTTAQTSSGYFSLNDYDYTNENTLKISINATDYDGNSIADLITDIWDTTNSVAKGYISIVEADGTVTLFKITGGSTSGMSGQNLQYRTFDCLRVYGNEGGSTTQDGFVHNSFVDMTFLRNANDGIRGPQGATGAQGAVGPHGVEGVVGAQGNVGPHGVEGVVGAQGAQGPSVRTIVQLGSSNLSGANFLTHAEKRLIKIDNTSDITITVPQPSASHVGKTWIIVNASNKDIDIDANTQYVHGLNGSTTLAHQSDWELNYGGVAEIVCIASNSNGGSSSDPNYIIYGTGVARV